MKKRLLIPAILIFTILMTLVGCGDKAITDIEIQSGAPTEVYVGEQPDFSSVKLLVKYNDGTTKEINGSDAEISTPDTSKPGTASYTITYGGFSVSASITVKAREVGGGATGPATLTGITYSGGLDLNPYKGAEFDTIGIMITANYSDGSNLTVKYSDLTFEGEIDTDVLGEQTFVVKYGGFSLQIKVNVQEVKFDRFTVDISTIDTSKEYYVGDTVDTSMAVGTAIYNNGTTKPLSSVDIQFSINNTAAGSQELKATYGGKTITVFTFNFIAVQDVSMVVTGTVADVIYGDTLNTSALTAVVSRNNGTVKTLTNSELIITGADTATPGDKKLTVSYGNLSAEVSYKVVDITSMKIMNVYPEVLVGETVNTANMKLELTLSNGKTVNKTVADGVVVDTSVFNSSSLGETSIKATYKGKTAEFKIQVVEVRSNQVLESLAYQGGIDTSIFVGDVFTTDGIAVLAKFDNGYELVLHKEDLVITNNVTTGTAGRYAVVASYEHEGVTKTCTVTVDVVAVVATDITLNKYEISTERNVNPVLSSVSAIVNYNNGTKKTLAIGDLTYDIATLDLATLGDKTLVLSYAGVSVNLTVKVVAPILARIDIIGDFAKKAIVGETYDFSKVKLTLIYSNGETETISYGVDGLVVALDTASAGTKTLTASYKGFTDSVNVELLTVSSVLLVVPSDYKTTVKIGEFTTAGLTVTLTLSNGDTVTRTLADGVVINMNNLDVNVADSGYITATYLGVTSQKLAIDIVEEEISYSIVGVSHPTIDQWNKNVYQNNFLDSGFSYKVGSANPFKFQLLIDLIDDDGEEVTGYTGYVGASEVLLDGAAVGDEYVIIDDDAHTFQFTKAAEGKTFTIKTRPVGVSADKINLFTKTLEVYVVDAYNVYSAKELHLMTNASKTIGGTEYDQLEIVKTFLANHGITYQHINGVVLHDNIVINGDPQSPDLPEQFYFKTADGKTYLWNHFSLFYRQLEKGTFNFYGNYFTVVSNIVPIVAPLNTVDVNGVNRNVSGTEQGSCSEVFRFDLPYSVTGAEGFDHKDYVVNIEALGMHDNDPSKAEQTADAMQRSMLGVYALKFAKGVYNLKAVNVESYYMSMMAEYDCLTVNMDYCKFYDAWNAHVNIWTENDVDDDNATTLHADHQPITIDIKNSFIAKAGGPAILSFNSNPGNACNSQSGVEITIDSNSTVFSYVAGDESWFVANGIVMTAKQIAGMSQAFAPYGASYQRMINGKSYINMVYINMDPDFIPGVTAPDNIKDIDGTITIGGRPLVNMDDSNVGTPYQSNYGYGNPLLDGINATGAPLFLSSNGGVSLYHPDLAPSMGMVTTQDGQNFNYASADATTGDYITLYYYNLGVLLGFNETAIDKEPAPPAAPMVTVPHN